MARRSFRSWVAGAWVAAVALGLAGCGDDGGPPRVEDGAPLLTHDWGRYAYAFLAVQDGGELGSILAYSDGSKAVFVVLPANALADRRAARIVASVASPYIADAESGQMNLDGDGTFADNDLTAADGIVILDPTRQALGTSEGGVTVGSTLSFSYTFVVTLSEVIPLDAADGAYADMLYGAGFP